MGKSTALSGAEGAEGETGANAVFTPSIRRSRYAGTQLYECRAKAQGRRGANSPHQTDSHDSRTHEQEALPGLLFVKAFFLLDRPRPVLFLMLSKREWGTDSPGNPAPLANGDEIPGNFPDFRNREKSVLSPAPPAPPATMLLPRQTASAASEQSPLASVSASGENAVRFLAPPFPTKSSILRGPRFGDWRERVFLNPAPPVPPATMLLPRQTASAASEQSPLASVSASGENAVRFLAPPFPTKSSILRGPRFGDWRERVFLNPAPPVPPATMLLPRQTASASRRGATEPRSQPWGRQADSCA